MRAIIMAIMLFTLANGFYIPLEGVARSKAEEMDDITISKLVKEEQQRQTDDDFSLGSQLLEIDQKIFKKKKSRFQRDQKSKEGDASNLHIYIKGSPESTDLERRQSSGSTLGQPPIQCKVIKDADRQPFLCYQCSSTFDDKDPICDHTLWRFTRRSEKYKLRVRCPHGQGNYCVKKVQRKRGAQLTERGCFGPGPVKGKDGSVVVLQEGCVTYRQNGFLTTTCLCKGDLCNFGSRIAPSGGFGLVITATVVAGVNLLL